MSNRLKLLTISDHPLCSSGVANQTKYFVEGLLSTGKYTVRSLGAAMKHASYQPQRVQEWGDNWIILPIDGYGDENMMREILDTEKPDAVWVMTDIRFYEWLFNMSDEIRDRGIPLFYQHVWDNFPVPTFNKNVYHSCDFIGCISKLTHDIVCELGMKEHCQYIPHAVNKDVFRPLSVEKIKQKKANALGDAKDKFVIFYNSRNARRKMTSDVVKIFKQFLDKHGDVAFLLMHTDPKDREGANLIEVAKMLDIKPHQLAFSNARVPPEDIASMYNIADVTMNISNNEGWGLSVLESLMCATPVIANFTGGMRDQIVDKNGFEFGVAVKPVTRSLTGSQQIPFIFDDRCSDEDLLAALEKIYAMPDKERKELGMKARERCLRDFSLEDMVNKWDKAIVKYVNQFKEKGYPERVRVAVI